MKGKRRYNAFADDYPQYDTSNGHGNARDWRESFYHTMTGEEADEILEQYQDEDAYSILGIKRNATQAEIKTAFRKAMQQWHPDMNPTDVDRATEMAKKINAAYNKLKEG